MPRLPLIKPEPANVHGAVDDDIQAFSYRLCLTRSPSDVHAAMVP